MAEGWIKIHRKIQDSRVWTCHRQPFDYRSAWIDLLLMANHKDAKIIVDYDEISVKRGQLLTSTRQLGERWHWSKDRVCKYLRLIESEKMVSRSATTRYTLLTIENYDFYQCDVDTGLDTEQTQSRHGSATNKNVKNEKNNINIYLYNKKDSLSGSEPDLTPPVKKSNDVELIIDYLNSVLGTHYKATTKANASKIKARLAEGHTVDDFKTVIDKKAKQWRNDPEMSPYLRPETLFAASHFESYLNEIEKTGSKKDKPKFGDYTQRDIDYAELERLATNTQ